jgi:PAS domain S-box-containing protein
MTIFTPSDRTDARWAASDADLAPQTSEQEFRLLAEAMPQMVWIARPDGSNIYFNRQWSAYTGLPPGEGRGDGWIVPVHPDDRQRACEAWQTARQNFQIYSLECRLRRADGVYRWWLIRGVPMRNDRGEVVKWFGACTDIEAVKQAEEKVRQLNTELEQRVRDRTAELATANRELEVFAYSVSHDLRAPLRSIDGFSRILLQDYAAKLDDEGRDSLHRICAATQRMAQLIDDMLDLSRASRGELRRERVDLSALARAAIADLRQIEPGRVVEVSIADGLMAEGDPLLLRAVAENLLGNAWKFTGKRAQARIEFGALPPEEGAGYFVRDNGAGFDPTYAGKLFGPFQRLHNSSEFPGTGIGLATVQRIVNRHGGHVWAEGHPDAGATFYFTLNARA